MSKPVLVAAVVRRGAPRLIEAMLVPAVLFYVCLVVAGVGAAYLAALGCAYGAIAVRRVARRPVSALLVMVSVGLTARTAVAVGTSSTFVYFAQPLLGSVVLAGFFVGSVLCGRPIIARLADDFCPLDADAASRGGVALLFRRLTYLWAAVILMKAGATLGLMLTLPLSTFVLTRTLTTWALTAAAVALTFALSFRTARCERLVPAFVAGEHRRFHVTAAHNTFATGSSPRPHPSIRGPSHLLPGRPAPPNKQGTWNQT